MFLLLVTTATVLLTSSFITPVCAVPVPELDDRQAAALSTNFPDPLPAAATAVLSQETWVPAAPTAITWDDALPTAVLTNVPDAPIYPTAVPSFVLDPSADYSVQDAASLFARKALAAKLVEERQDQPISISFNPPAAITASVDYQPEPTSIVVPDLFDNGNGTANGTTNGNATGTATGTGDGSGDGEGICWWCWYNWW